jgi:hypothetical protein
MKTTLALVVTIVALGCGDFHAPPEPSIVGLQNGVLQDASQPLVVQFSEPIDPSTLALEVADFDLDAEGRLPDERGDDETLNDYYAFSAPDGTEMGGSNTLSPDGRTLTITPRATFPIGPRLVLVVEPGLVGTNGVDTHARRKVPFGYAVKLDCHAPSTVMSSGYYFLLMNVKNPVAVQVQLYIDLRIANDGSFIGQFTKARRNPDPNRCPTPCKSTEACRLLPSPSCVIPSERADTVDEFPDWIPNTDTSIGGFTFTAKGCVIDQPDGSATFANLPADIKVESPNVTLRAVRLTARFLPSPDGPRATGSATADDVLLGTIESGPAQGDVLARAISAADAPSGIPAPPPP